MLLLLRNNDTFHEHRPRGIYIIGEIVFHMMLMIINRHFRSTSSYDINEQWRLIEHINVVIGTDDSKKHVISSGHKKQQLQDDCRMFDAPV
jgi:hypothetical protein